MRALAWVLLAGCHPLAPWHPPSLGPEPVRVAAGEARIEILYDGHGIPHVFGADETELAFGLGFVHARDRGFAMELVKHAAWGRLAELFGPELLDTDRELRLITMGLAATMKQLSARDRAIAERYAAGVNTGLAHAGRSAEMALLGIRPAPFRAEDAVAIGLLQTWQLTAGLDDELDREVALARFPPEDPRRALFLRAVADGGVPIVGEAGRRATSTSDARVARRPTPPRRDAALRRWLGLDAEGASNSWAVGPRRTASGFATLVNDPHLAHRVPSVFYLVHLEAPGFTVAGASFPGVPAVLIGRTRHLAWGMTTAYADAQDLLRLDVIDSDHYRVDGHRYRFGVVEQRFAIAGAPEVRERWQTTLFGPVLPERLARGLERRYAIQWSGFSEANAQLVSGFWDLARARDLREADGAIERMSLSGQNVALAFTDGTIAYRLAARAPVRPPGADGLVALEGDRLENAWRGHVPLARRPSLTDPARGFLLTANQRVVGDEAAASRAVGRLGAAPWRAQRIERRLEALLAEGPASAGAILEIQQDAVSAEAERLAPILGPLCAAPEELCARVRAFDGRFSAGSPNALAYDALKDALDELIIEVHLGAGAELSRRHFFKTMVAEELEAEAAARPSALFDRPETPAREGLEWFVREAAGRAAEALRAAHGDDPEDWSWGEAHRGRYTGPLASAPLIGGFWTIDHGPEDGHKDAIRAEGPRPIKTGAALRMLAELSPEPRAWFILDTGQSGHAGHRHFEDMAQRWKRGELVELVTRRDAIDVAGRIVLEGPSR